MQNTSRIRAGHINQRRRTRVDGHTIAHTGSETAAALARLADEHTRANSDQRTTSARVSSSEHTKPQAQRPQNLKKEGWYVLTAKGDVGPFESREIVAAAERGEITPGTELRHGRTGRLVLAGQVRGLFPRRRPPAGSTPKTARRKQPLVRK